MLNKKQFGTLSLGIGVVLLVYVAVYLGDLLVPRTNPSAQEVQSLSAPETARQGAAPDDNKPATLTLDMGAVRLASRALSRCLTEVIQGAPKHCYAQSFVFGKAVGEASAALALLERICKTQEECADLQRLRVMLNQEALDQFKKSDKKPVE